MANTYGTIASSGKNDFERFMEDMNKIGGYDSNRESTSNLVTIDTKPDKPTGSSTTATANQGTVTNYGSTPSYDRQDDLLDRKERIAVENRNWTRYRDDLDKSIQRGREDIARGDALETQRYNRNKARNDRFQGWADRSRAQNNINADRLAQKRKERGDRKLARSAQNQNYRLKTAEINAMNSRYNAELGLKRDELGLKDKELGMLGQKYNAEIAALNNDLRLRENQNQQQWASMALNYANSAMDRGLRQQELESQRRGQDLARQARIWETIGGIYS